MKKMISVASGFQYSVNIGYDLNRDDKLKNFIPTRSALVLLEDILKSTSANSTERARVLVGAYGKGKSHIILMILSMLMKKEYSLFEKLIPKIEENPELYQLVQNYYESDNKILPVIINGTSTSIPQAFLLALQRTLADNDLLDIMPETNYKAAVNMIEKWKSQYPDVFEKLKGMIDCPIDRFISELNDYNVLFYEQFEKLYPTLAAGSIFNPFLGFDVVELYESVVKSLKKKGYTGIYVVYDEFSKFLEANITAASISDTKMLQDFAEKCNRSGKEQMHLLLISHKEISNYIDKLPKQKVDGWRGVSERFKHIRMNDNFTQTYDIIASVIQKDEKLWDAFCEKHKAKLRNLSETYMGHAIFIDSTREELESTVYGCYPLHPVSTFILPRLSERVAQNERTLFTFLSADGTQTLTGYLRKYNEKSFKVITPDAIYDYFEPLLQKEPISGELHKNYILTATILDQIHEKELESKIVKTIALIYILGQFEKLKPTKDELVKIFSTGYTTKDIENAIDRLIKEEYVVYLKRGNDYLKLKQTSGVDIEKKIADMIASQASNFSVKESLNGSNIDSYLYPSRYNDEREMVRYFEFEFIEEQEVEDGIDWNQKCESSKADGMIYAVISESDESIGMLRKKITMLSENCERCIFIVPKKHTEIRNIIQEFTAVASLKEKAQGDTVLFEEYELVYEDLREVINSFINRYTHPEEYGAVYIYQGREHPVLRKASLTGLMSDICEKIYSLTPVINNEALNRDEITVVAGNSRNKVLAGLVRNELEPNLGLLGSGQEVSMMRSTLLRMNILVETEGVIKINLNPPDSNMKHVLDVIVEFIMEAQKEREADFSGLYNRLVHPRYHIGLRKGLIPIYLAAVFHEYRQKLILQNQYGQIPINADSLQMINAYPEGFSLIYLNWDSEKERFIASLSDIFADYIVDAERTRSSYEFIAAAMRRWYMSLPKFTKETRKLTKGQEISRRYLAMLKLLKQNTVGNELLFEKLPEAFGYTGDFNAGLAENIAAAKTCFDKAVSRLRERLIVKIKEMFVVASNIEMLDRVSLTSVIKDWCDTLNPAVFQQLFEDGTDKCLGLFSNITNDEEIFVARLAKLATDLRIEDWNDNTEEVFESNLLRYKQTAEEFHGQVKENADENVSMYEITFRNSDGQAVTKRFDKVETSSRGRLLHNTILSELDSMGYSITEQEKRQILMEILKNMC